VVCLLLRSQELEEKRMEVMANLDGEREEFGWFCVDVRMNLCCGAFFGREGFATIVLPLPM